MLVVEGHAACWCKAQSSRWTECILPPGITAGYITIHHHNASLFLLRTRESDCKKKSLAVVAFDSSTNNPAYRIEWCPGINCTDGSFLTDHWSLKTVTCWLFTNFYFLPEKLKNIATKLLSWQQWVTVINHAVTVKPTCLEFHNKWSSAQHIWCVLMILRKSLDKM